MCEELMTVIEHANYLKKAVRLLSEQQMEDIVDRLAADPRLGRVIQGSGGFRKFRYAGVPRKGKSRGYRIIHFYVDRDKEVHIVDIFAKADVTNLTKAQRNELAAIAALLKGSTHD